MSDTSSNRCPNVRLYFVGFRRHIFMDMPHRARSKQSLFIDIVTPKVEVTSLPIRHVEVLT